MHSRAETGRNCFRQRTSAPSHLQAAISNHAQKCRDQHYLQHGGTVVRFATNFELRRGAKGGHKGLRATTSITVTDKAPELQNGISPAG